MDIEIIDVEKPFTCRFCRKGTVHLQRAGCWSSDYVMKCDDPECGHEFPVVVAVDYGRERA